MPEIPVNIELYCAGCRQGICNNATAGTTKTRREACFDIEPCEKCLQRAREEGYEEGYQAGIESTRED